jgi:hypothetical protein
MGEALMATWSEIQTYIRRNYQTRELDDGNLIVPFEFGDGRSHQCIVGPNNEEGTWTQFWGIICDWSTENLIRAVELNQQIFGVDRFGDFIVLTHAQLTATADIDEIDSALGAIAMAADSLEEALTGKDEY